MSLLFTGLKRKNPKEIENRMADKWYLSVNNINTCEYEALMDLIAAECTLTKSDVSGIVESILFQMMVSLSQGDAVKLGDIGTFRVNVSSEGVIDKMDVNTNLVKKLGLRYLPSVQLKNYVKQSHKKLLDSRYWITPTF